MTATEQDLTLTLQHLASEAPTECTTFVTPSRPARRRLTPTIASAAAVVLLGAGAFGVVAGRPSVGNRDVPAGSASGTGMSSSSPSPVIPSLTPAGSPSTFIPTTRERRQLIAIGNEAGSLNSDPTPQISVVGTTAGRLLSLRPALLFGHRVTASPTSKEDFAPSDHVWVVWLRGSFDEYGTPLMIDLVDGRTMRDLGGTFDNLAGDTDPAQLSELGVVVNLR